MVDIAGSKTIIMIALAGLLSLMPQVSAFQVPSSLSSSSRSTAELQRIRTEADTRRLTQQNPAFKTCLYMSDIPKDDERSSRRRQPPNQLPSPPEDNDETNQVSLTAHLHQWVRNLTPPPMEDQWTLMGDLGSLVLYSITSHSINDLMVKGILDSSDSLQKAVESLDPTGDVFTTSNSIHMLQVPVWHDANSVEVMNSITTSIINDKMMQHWGPMFGMTGASAVILCSFWMFAGWLTRAFLFENTLECSTVKALQTTVSTWLVTLFLISLTAWTANHYIVPTWINFQEMHVPFSSYYHSHATVVNDLGQIPALYTGSDWIFVTDCVSVLLAWRFMASMFWGYSNGTDDDNKDK